MIDSKALLPILKGTLKGTDEQIMEALMKLAKAHPELSNAQALAALQHVYQQKKSPSMKGMALQGGLQ